MNTARLTKTLAATAVAVVLAGGTAFAVGSDDARTALTSSLSSTSSATGPTTDREAAVAAALDHVGGGVATDVELELEIGGREWQVEVVDGTTEHDVRIDDATGAVTRSEVDDDRYDDDRYDDRDDDDRDDDDRGGENTDDRGSDG